METSEAFHQLLQGIGNRLYHLRHERREKLTSVASSVGISHPVISQIENGRYKGLTIELLHRLSSHYKISIEELLAEKNMGMQLSPDSLELVMQHLKIENKVLKDILGKQQTS